MAYPNVQDLNEAARLCTQKMVRYMAAKMRRDEGTAALEWTNLDLAWSEYHMLQDRAPREVLEAHLARRPEFDVIEVPA